MKLILPIVMGTCAAAILLSCMACELVVSPGPQLAALSAGLIFGVTAEEATPSSDASESEDFWNDKPMAPKRMSRTLRRQLTIAGAFIGVLIVALLVFAGGQKRNILQAPAVLAAEMTGLQGTEAPRKGHPQWFYGTHRDHDFAFTVVGLKNNRGGVVQGYRHNNAVRLIVATNRVEPLDVIAYRHPRRQRCKESEGFDDCFDRTNAETLSSEARTGMLQFARKRGSLRLRDREGSHPMLLHASLFTDKKTILGYEGWGQGWSTLKFDKDEINDVLDELVEIARELEQ